MNLKQRYQEAMKRLESATTAEEVEAAKSELAMLKSAIDAAKEAQGVLGAFAPEGKKSVGQSDAPAKSLGEHFVKFREAHGGNADNRIIATPFKAAGDPTPSTNLVATQFDREVVRRVPAPLTVLDLFGRKTISEPVYSWNAYSSTTGSVGTTSEGSTKNKLTYTYAPKTATLQKITGLIKMTEELFEDAPYVADAINQDLVDDLNANRQTQAITTLLATSGLATDTVTYSTAIDIFQGILDVAADIEDATNIPCDAVVVTPAIWKILRGAVASDGHFYAGDPFGEADYKRLFEMTFVKNADLTANHIIVGAFDRGGDLVSKADGVRVDSTNSNDVDFEKNLVSVRAECREILAVKRPACFCNVTLSANPS